ncbi:MAG: phage terminase large subunit family protein [Azoarcus sp.]|jgi:phage terminase large subunit GpA-like protein|nr:phage terminase large subunit family protein [Azoarcus sp.]
MNKSHATAALDALLSRVFAKLRPRPPLTPLEWVERYRYLSAEENPDYPGPFSTDNIPALRGILAACGIPGVRRIVAQKSAQIAWTAGILCTLMAYHVHWRPCVQVAMFPREKSAKDFDAEKFAPMVRATPVLARRISLKSRAAGNSTTRKHYPGGLLKFVASNSPSDVKSTSAKIRYVEEPDDTNKDVRGQGNSIALLRERGKTIRDSFELIGGTPTAKGASEIEHEMRTTDQRRFLAPCHHCGERHAIDWENVTIPGLNLPPETLAAPDIDQRYPLRDIYGRARFEDAFYACPHCGGIWTDDERIANIRRAAAVGPHHGWEPTTESADPGFYLNELLSVFDGSRLPRLAEKYLRAQHRLERGDPTEMIAFWNATRGLPWEYKGELPEEADLEKRAENYPEWTTPGGVYPLVGVDVQHDRLAVVVWVIGRGEEMWLAWWGELHGPTIVPHAGAWLELDALLARTVAHASGVPLPITAVAIDCSDGQTSDAVYSYVRRHDRPGRPVIAVKGASDDTGRVEIWTPPKPIDPNIRATKAARYGVHAHIVGTAKAKDTLLGWAQEGGRVRLLGHGPARMHWFQNVRPDFYEQLLSEIKIPAPSNPNRRIWKRRTDRRNEVLDGTVYVLYLSRHLRLHLKRPAHWDMLELNLRQPTLITDQPAPAVPAVSAIPAPIENTPPPTAPRPPRPAIAPAEWSARL